MISPLVLVALVQLAEPWRRLDAPIPPAPPATEPMFRARELGSPVTIFVNFDGIDLGECSPSNSKKNCHWYNTGPIDPYSGSMQTKVAVLQAMRRDAADFGVRITGARPDGDDDYVMVVYGGTEADYGALGSAPSGDCWDEHPNEIAFAHLEGADTWVNGGATTALHEAAHTWGLDHVDLVGEVMYPASDNRPTAFAEGCLQIVENTELVPGGVSCPEVNPEFCETSDQQDARPLLATLFGPPYVDITPPVLALDGLEDGQYFQAPATFDVVLDVQDDLHPQAYSMWAWLEGEPRPSEPSTVVAPGFQVADLPVGTWEFHVAIADEAGHEAQMDFTIEVGLDPPPEPEDEGCRVGGRPPGLLLLLAGPLLLASVRRRR